jgi:protein-L-isoaspartate(D-aspartate) O-methyltransferase
MRGAGQHADRLFLVTDPNGMHMTLRFDGYESDLTGLDGVLAMERVEVWPRVTIKHQTSFADLHLLPRPAPAANEAWCGSPS